MHTKRNAVTRRLASTLLGALLLGGASHSFAQQPLGDRPVKIVVPYSAGGPVDLAFRALGEAIAPILGVPVVIESKPGASGKIAAELVARSEPDGHTLLAVGTTQAISLPLLDKSVRYDALKDFRVVSLYVDYEMIFMTSPTSGIKSMKELVARMQEKNNDVVYASIGQPYLTSTGQAFLVFSKMTNGRATEVAYPGQAPGLVDLLAGRVTFSNYLLSGTQQHIENGKLVALAVASPKRIPELPNVPTMAEAGYPEFMSVTNWVPWMALMAPAKTADNLVNAINAAVVKAAQSDQLKAQIAQAGLRLRARGTAAQDDAEWRSDYARLATTLKRYDIRAPEEAK